MIRLLISPPVKRVVAEVAKAALAGMFTALGAAAGQALADRLNPPPPPTPPVPVKP